MSNTNPVRKYFSAYENKDRKAFKCCWPYSEQTYEIEKMLEKDNEALILYDCKTKTGGRCRNTEFFTSKEAR